MKHIKRIYSQSPFRLMCKVTGSGVVLSLVLTCYLFVTSYNTQQYVLCMVVLALMLLLSLAVGFYVACLYQRERERVWHTACAKNIHYPLRAEFEVKSDVVDQQVRKYQRV